MPKAKATAPRVLCRIPLARTNITSGPGESATAKATKRKAAASVGSSMALTNQLKTRPAGTPELGP